MDKRTQLRELTAIVTGIREITTVATVQSYSHLFQGAFRYYRVTLVVEYLGWVDLDLGSSQKIKMLQPDIEPEIMYVQMIPELENMP